LAISSRENESLLKKYSKEIEKTEIGDTPIQYFKISPINNGSGVHLTHIIIQDMKLGASRKNAVASKQKDMAN